MKKLFACLLALVLCGSFALAEFDTAPLKADPELYAMEISGTVNTAYRPVNQPYIGQVDEGYDGELVAYVDYITLVDEGVTLLRLVVSSTVYDFPSTPRKSASRWAASATPSPSGTRSRSTTACTWRIIPPA